MFLAQGNTITGIASHSPINTAESTGAMRVKFLAQGDNSKQQCLGIEPGSPGSQADPKPLMPLLPLSKCLNLKLAPVCSSYMFVKYCNKGHKASHGIYHSSHRISLLLTLVLSFALDSCNKKDILLLL